MRDNGRCSGRERAANDNRDADGSEPEALRKVNAVALKLAHIIGRRMAREDFAGQSAANDNAPTTRDRARKHTDDED